MNKAYKIEYEVEKRKNQKLQEQLEKLRSQKTLATKKQIDIKKEELDTVEDTIVEEKAYKCSNCGFEFDELDNGCCPKCSTELEEPDDDEEEEEEAE